MFKDGCARDIDWLQEYYSSVFPAGAMNGRAQYKRAKQTLRMNPYIGHPSEVDGVREFAIAKTPFAFIYQVTSEGIEILRIWDQRSSRPPKWL